MKPALEPVPGARKIVLIRHEHTELAGTFCGHLDPPLSVHGRAQLPQLVSTLSHYRFTTVYSSDLRRAQETADALVSHHRVSLRLRADLRELAFGEWEGLAWEQVVARDSHFAQRWLDQYPSLATPGGEEFHHFVARIQLAIGTIADEVEDGCAAVVTHSGVIRTIIAGVALECPPPIDPSSCAYGSWWEIWRQEQRWALRSFSVQSTEHEGAAAKIGRTA